MAIIASYFRGETYGLLGPQMAATLIQEHSPFDCMVIGVTREDDKTRLKKALAEFFGRQKPIVGFSTLSGREDLFALAKELRAEGAFPILAGPQADVDYLGETDRVEHPHRFQGLSAHFSCALSGPAEAAMPLLKGMDTGRWREGPGLIHLSEGRPVVRNPRMPWDERFLGGVKWDNLYILDPEGLRPHLVRTGQVLQQIGCPYASRSRAAEIDYPAFLGGRDQKRVKLSLKGCAFCDVAADKGFYGTLEQETVLDQIRCLSEDEDGRKIPFELINENPLPGLPGLLNALRRKSISCAQINLIMRADWFLKGQEPLRQALTLARDMDIRILLASVGFESFDDTVLSNFNKGLKAETNLRAIFLMRRLKEEFPLHWGYSRQDGALHGFIHPTPWDTEKTRAAIQETVDRHGLALDILPPHSTPLIIHHASRLGDWAREVECAEGVRFGRRGSIIEWWRVGGKLILD